MSIRKKFIAIKSRITYKKILKTEFSLLKQVHNKKIILFLLPDCDFSGGGVMSISSIYEESKKLESVHGYEVIASKCPYEISNTSFNKFTKFESSMDIFHFESIVQSFNELESIIIHIPEYIIPSFVTTYDKRWTSEQKQWWLNIKNRHINIINQNIQMMPEQKYIEELRELSTKLTQTTAHHKYGTLETQESFNVTLHHLSVRSDFDKIVPLPFERKEKLIMLSPDDRGKNKKVMQLFQRELPDFKLQVVSKLTYAEYIELCKRAMFSITFGEGLDGYFAEPMLYGGVSFAIYNEEFFMPEYKDIPTIYANYLELLAHIVKDMKSYTMNGDSYKRINAQFMNIHCSFYSQAYYLENIRKFYSGDYQVFKG